ncbi:hypothetical protein YTPLAS21_07090 [Candidatus Nitrosocosmicus sp.]|jgi:hypothetical protein|nr:hypothetical protein YTPLAS21_07090 [Candidatus Nitrosocosmicus sp.]
MITNDFKIASFTDVTASVDTVFSSVVSIWASAFTSTLTRQSETNDKTKKK